MTTYKIAADHDEETDEVLCWMVKDSDGYMWDGFEARQDAEEFVSEREAEERQERARDIFLNDLAALEDEVYDWTPEQIRTLKNAMIDGLRAARAMARD